MKNWQKAHGEVINSFLKYLNNITADFVLKGGTALLVCYGLDRFSEDMCCKSVLPSQFVLS